MIDLHTHSSASDGTLSPSELVRLAAKKNIRCIGLTDHDTVGGIKEAMAAGEAYGVEVVPGVELSVSEPVKLHMLGYYVDVDYAPLQQVLAAQQVARRARIPRILEKLNRLGVMLTMEQVAQYASGVPGRSHVAQALVGNGYVASIQEAFWLYLNENAPAFIPSGAMTLELAIGIILEAGGSPVLAHPCVLGLDTHMLEALVISLKERGMVGMEAYYYFHTPRQKTAYAKMARRIGLIPTWGSDFHGSSKPDVHLCEGMDRDPGADYPLILKRGKG